MSRLQKVLALFVSALFLGGVFVTPALAEPGVSNQASTSAKSKPKQKCQKLKGKKKRQCLKNANKGGKKPSKGGKPWAGGPYRPGLTCAISKKMQKEYAKHGLFCLDISADFFLTTLVPLKGAVQ